MVSNARIILLVSILGFGRSLPGQVHDAQDYYNIVIILADDLGYGDLGCFGGEKLTPNIDDMAKRGMTFTHFYVSPICSPSRASLLTGCYPQRVGIPSVVGSRSPVGIGPDEELLPEVLKAHGYRTALFGKWHLGTREVFAPQNHGFDEFFGTLSSNDDGTDMSLASRRYGVPGLCLFDGRDTVEINPKQWELINQYTDRSIDFIDRNKGNPFFLYLAYNAPHTPLFVSDDFTGKSKINVYHDVLMEIDASVGRVMEAIRKNNLTNKTLVVFLSDNGPWSIFGNYGGSGAPLAGGKKQTLEGGVRVPCVMSLPGLIPAGAQCGELTTIMDFYPTVATLTGAKMTQREIDGKNILPLMKGQPGATSPHSVYYYYYKNALQAVRAGNFKLQLPHNDVETPDPNHPGYDGHRGGVYAVHRPLALFDLKSDPAERNDIANENPSVVKRMLKMAEEGRKKFGDSIVGKEGREVRSPGQRHR